MERVKLENYYNNNITEIANKVVSLYSNLVFTPNPNAFFEEYLSLKALVKLVDGPGNSNPLDKLDRYKRSACMMTALLKLRQIQDLSVVDNTHEPSFITNSTRANAQLSVLVGLDKLMTYTVTQMPGTLDGFILPENTTEREGGTYLDSLVRSLYYTGLANVGGINIHLLAHIFFLLEQYHVKSKESS